MPFGRAYSNVVFDPSTQLIVAASSLQAHFASYDEDGGRLWESDGEFERELTPPFLFN
jgi:cleavage and polyadenylation specificity factor subunit 1